MVDFFIASSQSPLQVDTADCYFLAGADLHVKAKQSSDTAFNRQTFGSTKSTVSQRGPEKRPLHSKGSRSELNTIDSNSPHGTLKGNQPLKGIGKFFGSTTKKPDQLQELLHSYTRNGLPSMPDLLELGRKKFDPAIFELENSWTDIVKDSKNCNRYQQEAIWELLKTEVAYIRDLRFVINLFLACLYNLQSQALLNDIETEKIFSNISDLHQANCLFYESHMYKVVTTARETGQPLEPTPLIQGFTLFCTYFEPYTKFCIEYMNCQQYLSRMKEENELFRMFLNWTENHPDCNRLSLRDYIGKPFQRLTKYKLLLERIWKSGQRPDNVLEMISTVDQFICRVNAMVTQLEIMRRIDSYDAVDLPNNDALTKMVSAYCRLDLTRPIPGSNRTRYLIEEGTLRMNNRTDVICFLFTDMLLITKSNKKLDINNKPRIRVYKPPMRLDKIFVNPLNDGGFMLVYLNEYNLATTAYTFHGEHARQWLERIRQTQDEYEKLRNAIMDQSEAYLLNLANGYEEYEDEYAYMNARSVAMEMGLDRVSVNRQVSVSSADTFMGNIPESGGGSGGRTGPDRGRPRSVTGAEIDRMRSRATIPIPPHVSESDRSPRDSPPATPLVSNSYSSNGATLNARFQSPQDQSHYTGGDTNYSSTPPATNKHMHNINNRSHIQQSFSSPLPISSSNKPESVNNTSSTTSANNTSQKQFVFPSNNNGEDGVRKVRPRRDRRYYTADMIQDMHRNPASIQKRLSWHSGNKDTDYEYGKQGTSNNIGKSVRTVSNDSIRSYYSSSGVSSVGSLQNPDHEISEESDWMAGEMSSEDSSQASDTTTKTRISGSTSTSTSSPPENTYIILDNDDDNTIQTPPPLGKVSFDDNRNVSKLEEQSQSSKSMPDISTLSVVDEGEGGPNKTRERAATCSVDLIREGQRRKLSDSQNRMLKLQILNSTLEATDV